jgi:hypothetical protein
MSKNSDRREDFMIRISRAGFVALALLGALQAQSQTPPRQVRIFLDLRETNLNQPSTVATNTISERLSGAGFRVTTNRKEAALVVEGTIASRTSPVTDDVQKQGGVNVEASASVRLLSGREVIATSVERSAPGDWGVSAERLGEDRLLEVAGRVADELFSGQFFHEVTPAPAKPAPARSAAEAKGAPEPKVTKKAPARRPAPKRGVSYLEVVSLVQNYAPEERIVAALRKYGIKFQPKDAALNQLRSLGATDGLISAIKSAQVVG